MDNLDTNRVNQEQEINLKEIIKQLCKKRKFIIIVVTISIFFGLFIAFTAPISYRADITIVTQDGQTRSNNLGGFASMMGVDSWGITVNELLSPLVYPRIVNSVQFCKEIMATPIVVERSNGVPITLYEYYTNEKYRPKNLLNSIMRYTIGLPGLILSDLRSSDTDDYTDGNTGKIILLTKEEWEVVEIIQKNIRIEVNSRDGYIVLSYTFDEPEAVATITQQLYSVLEEYVKDFKTQKQIENLEFVQLSYEGAQQNFFQKHAELAAFQDANRALSTAMARTAERRLENEFQLAFSVYNELARQLEQAKLAVKESTPLLTVIDPVVVPRERSAPRRGLILVVFLFLGVAVGSGWVLVKPFLGEIVREIREEKSEE
jgi:uncharacterized protein involved in exopolysaccharide biosynthesis